MNSESQYVQRRRSVRVMLSIPVTVSSVGKDPLSVYEKAHTLNVSVYGALLHLSSRLEPEMFLELTNGQTERGAIFRVVYIRAQSTDAKYDTGVESISPLGEFWGIKFPAIAEKA